MFLPSCLFFGSSANIATDESDPDHTHSYGVVAKFACNQGFTLEVNITPILNPNVPFSPMNLFLN